MDPTESERIVTAHRDIHGWFSDEAAMLFGWIDEIQKHRGVTGDLFEIGAHHGKSTVHLAAMADAQTESLGVCDLFDQQADNVSGSGKGDLDEFRQNLAPALNRGLDLRLYQTNSLDLTPEEIGRQHRFFHIDGGHDTQEALSDLELAADSVLGRGVIVLDDPFRPEWPGVTEALIRFLDRYHQFTATVVGFNKIVLTTEEARGMYRRPLREEAERTRYGLGEPWRLKELPFHERPLLIFYVPTFLQTPRSGAGGHDLTSRLHRLHATVRQAASKPIAWLTKKWREQSEPG